MCAHRWCADIGAWVGRCASCGYARTCSHAQPRFWTWRRSALIGVHSSEQWRLSALKPRPAYVRRYLAVSRPGPTQLSQVRTHWRVPLLIALAWLVSALLSVPIPLGVNRYDAYVPAAPKSTSNQPLAPNESALCTLSNADFLIYRCVSSPVSARHCSAPLVADDATGATSSILIQSKTSVCKCLQAVLTSAYL